MGHQHASKNRGVFLFRDDGLSLPLNSSTIDELGSWCLRRAGGAGQQFWQRGGGIHRNPASGHRPGTVTLIESVEYLPAPNTYPREGGVGKKSSAK